MTFNDLSVGAMRERARKTYFFFYGITYAGSALTSVSSFLMVEKLTGTLTTLGWALALKTAFMALASPLVARHLARMPMRRGLWISQFLGMFLLLPLGIGMYSGSTGLFLLGMTIGGLPNLILATVGTAYLKLTAGSDIDNFRKQQGRLQLVISLCFTASIMLSPLLLRWFSYPAILGLDFVTYVFGAVYIFQRRGMETWEVAESPPPAMVLSGPLGYWRLNALSAASGILMVYLLKGLPPLVAGNPTLTLSLGMDTTLRQTLWVFEALAGITAGLVYKQFHSQLKRWHIFELGLVNGIFLSIALVGLNYFGVALALFLLSLSMTLCFMNLRDSFIAQYTERREVLWATGLINVAVNTALTLSPLLIGVCLERFALPTLIAAVVAAQIFVFFIIRYLNLINPAKS